MSKPVNQDRLPNFRDEKGNLYLVRCFACPGHGDRGKENYAMSVSGGICAWCGWEDKKSKGRILK